MPSMLMLSLFAMDLKLSEGGSFALACTPEPVLRTATLADSCHTICLPEFQSFLSDASAYP